MLGMKEMAVFDVRTSRHRFRGFLQRAFEEPVVRLRNPVWLVLTSHSGFRVPFSYLDWGYDHVQVNG